MPFNSSAFSVLYARLSHFTARLFPPLFSLPLLRQLPLSFRPPILVFISVGTYLPMFAFWQTHGVTCMTVTGASMFPLLNGDADRTTKKDWVLVDMRNPVDGLKRGMVVTFWSPTSPSKPAIKRIVALENDTVITKPPYPFPTETIPRGHVWVEGEHPEGGRLSWDSNHYGPVGWLSLMEPVGTEADLSTCIVENTDFEKSTYGQSQGCCIPIPTGGLAAMAGLGGKREGQGERDSVKNTIKMDNF